MTHLKLLKISPFSSMECVDTGKTQAKISGKLAYMPTLVSRNNRGVKHKASVSLFRV